MVHIFTNQEISDIKSGKSFLIDVRSPEEVNAGGIKYATNWDVQQMAAGRFPDIPKNAPIFVFCRSGGRSSEAQRLLGGAGFTNAHDAGSILTIPQDLNQ